MNITHLPKALSPLEGCILECLVAVEGLDGWLGGEEKTGGVVWLGMSRLGKKLLLDRAEGKEEESLEEDDAGLESSTSSLKAVSCRA